MNDVEGAILAMYKRVAIPFLHVAGERGEKLTEKTLLNIVVKFVMMAEVMADEVVEDHLAYELEKYRKEGLRPDYRE